jgi:hypothetical protein
VEKANFSGAVFENTRLVVTFDQDTVWPDGFDPEAHGAIPVDLAAKRERASAKEPTAE